MYKLGKYKKSDKMYDLICENYQMLLVLSRFGIALGFGEKGIGEVCRESGVDVQTFLTVVNMLLDDEVPSLQENQVSVPALVTYLHNSHSYFLDFRLPAIREKLFEATDSGATDVSVAIMRFFDEYEAEVRKHMRYEETTVFPYVNSLLAGIRTSTYNISVFRKQHNQVEAKLAELKNIIIKYYPATGSHQLNSVLFDIFSCEQDLWSHNRIENELFVPAILLLENKNGIDQ